MAELTTTAETTAADPCCAPEAQTTCCEPSARAECCDPSHGEGCGCAADATTTQGDDNPTAVAGLDVEINETHRVHAQAASAIVRACKPIEQPA